VKVCIALCIAAILACSAPVQAGDRTLGLAPADEYFGRYDLSVLGVANTIRDAGARIDAGADPRSMISGPLAFATDAIHAWEAKYPTDPWIAKDLLALETVYVRVPGDDGARLAAQTEAWLIADYPNSSYAAGARQQLAAGNASTADLPALPAPPAPAATPAAAAPIPSYATPWERFAALRVPLPPTYPRSYRWR
jgi:hypothetical protein